MQKKLSLITLFTYASNYLFFCYFTTNRNKKEISIFSYLTVLAIRHFQKMLQFKSNQDDILDY